MKKLILILLVMSSFQCVDRTAAQMEACKMMCKDKVKSFTEEPASAKAPAGKVVPKCLCDIDCQ